MTAYNIVPPTPVCGTFRSTLRPYNLRVQPALCELKLVIRTVLIRYSPVNRAQGRKRKSPEVDHTPHLSPFDRSRSSSSAQSDVLLAHKDEWDELNCTLCVSDGAITMTPVRSRVDLGALSRIHIAVSGLAANQV